jgi:hypothetical protein
MAAFRSPSSNPTRHRLAWTVFWVVSVLALAAGVVAALTSGHERWVVAIVMVGLCLVGVAAAAMSSLLLPLPGYDGGRMPFASGGDFGAVEFGSGGFDGGGSGGGDGGGGS